MTARWWPSSLRARITLWFAVVVGVPLVAFAIVSYVVFERTLVARTDHFMGDALSAFTRELANERRTAPTNAAAARTTVYEVRFRQLQIVLADSAGRLLAASPVEVDAESRVAGIPSLEPAAALATLRDGEVADPVATIDSPNGAYRLHTRTVPLQGASITVLGASSLADIEAVLARVRAAFLLAIPLLLVAAAIGGFVVARRSLAPIAAMGTQAAAITDATLHQRLPVDTPHDELGGLATLINSLLDRLERAFAQQRRFMADASHELRTPAAVLSTESQVTLSRPHRSEAEYRESMAVMQGAAGRLTRIVDDLFLLARADAGHLVARHHDLYLDEVVHTAVRAVRPIAERRGVRVELLPVMDAPFHGDADLLGRLLLNLLDNAIKFAVGRGTVSVELAARDGALGARYEIRVVDDGPGIPAEVQERVFERFFRGDPARERVEQSETSGAGLGLAISRRIAEAHGGTLMLVESRPGRTEFRVTFPAPADLATAAPLAGVNRA